MFADSDLYEYSQLFQHGIRASEFALGMFETIGKKENLEKSVTYRWRDLRWLSSFILYSIQKVG